MNEKQAHEARVLFLDYNRWRLQTGAVERRRAQGEFIRVYKETPERLALFSEMAGWCRAKQIDPRLWIYLLFRSRAWTFPPRMEKGHLMSERMVGRYEQMASKALDGYRFHLLAEYKKDRPYDPNWEMSPLSEAIKKRYASIGDAQRCMRETLERTLGFHPKSGTCQSCPLRQQCAEQLQKMIPEFDIVALREGKISPEEAQARVHAAAG